MIAALKKACKSLYEEFTSTKDSPHNIAFAFAIGVFLGILPFTGVLAAVGLAWYFKLNKGAAVAGSLLSNTWLSFVIFAISVHISCVFLKTTPFEVKDKFMGMFKDFEWSHLSDPFLLKLAGCVILGFALVTIILTLISYFACLAYIHHKRQPR